MESKKKWEIDISVLLVFFIRDSVFQKTFDAVKAAKPRRLLLWQDGPREGRNDDVAGIHMCQEIVSDENIDWDCEIYRFYNEKNYGCDPSTFLAHKWAFSLVDKCIVLEDDQVPGQSFFPFCKELLDRYENDQRISHICGYNNIPDYHCPNDYFFSYNGTGAWASWRRVAEQWDNQYTFLNDEYTMRNLKMRHGSFFKIIHKIALRHRATGRQYWESIMGFNCIVNSMYAIIPRVNLVTNLGLTENSVHSNAKYKHLSKETKKMFNASALNLEFPLKHPKYVVADMEYTKKYYNLMAIGHPIKRLYRKSVQKIKKRLIR